MLSINLEFLDNNNATIDNVQTMSLAVGQKVKFSIANPNPDLNGINWYTDADPVLLVEVAEDKLSATVQVSTPGESHLIIGKLTGTTIDVDAILNITAKQPLGVATALNISAGTPVHK